MKRKNPMRLNTKDAVYLQDRIEQEGFDYAFRHYSDFSEIKDKKFQSLRKAYVKAAQDLSDYARIEEDLRCVDCGEELTEDERDLYGCRCKKCSDEQQFQEDCEADEDENNNYSEGM